jgi:hypothetical protein
MEVESFFLPGRKQKEGRRDDLSIIVIGLYGRLDRQWQFNTNSKGYGASDYRAIFVGNTARRGTLANVEHNKKITGRVSAPVNCSCKAEHSVIRLAVCHASSQTPLCPASHGMPLRKLRLMLCHR